MGQLTLTANRRGRSRFNVAVDGPPIPPDYSRASGGTVITNTASLVEHEFTAGGTFSLISTGLLPVTYTITGTATFNGNGSSGTMDVTDPVTVTVTSGSVVVSYDPAAFVSFNPGLLSGLALWLQAYDPSTITIASGAEVDTWTDKSSNGFVVTTPGTGPDTGVETMNGKNVLTFNATDYMTVPSGLLTLLDAAGAGELFFVSEGDWDNGGGTGLYNNGAPIQGGTGGLDLTHQNFNDGNFYCGWGTTARKNTGNPTPVWTVPHMTNIRSASGSYVVQIDGAAHYSTATNTPDWTGGPTSGGATVGMHLGNNPTANSGNGTRWHGKILEIIVFSRILTTDERTKIKAFLATASGVTIA